MTDDFVADLERQLHSAAARRRRGRRRPPVAAAAGLIVALAVSTSWLAGRAGDGADPEIPAQPGPPRIAVSVPAAVAAVACPGREPRAIPAAGSTGRAQLGAFDRPPGRDDAIPDLLGEGDFSWVPATTVLPAEARRIDPPGAAAGVHLLPTLGVLEHEQCEAPGREGQGPGACMTVGGADAPLVRCFTVHDIARGRAVARTGPGRIHGIVPDGVERLVAETGSARDEVAVVENVYEARLDGIDAGDTVRLTFVLSARQPPCAPSPALERAVPALGAGSPSRPPPAQLAAVVDTDRALVDRWASVWEEQGDLTFWVVPQLRCGLVTGNDRACIAVAAEFVEGAVCATAREIAARGISDWFPVAGRPVVAGFAPAGATAARVSVPGHQDRVFGVEQGVFAGALPATVRMDRPEAYSLTFER